MASEPMECQVLVLRVSIHCEGCKKKVKKVLQNVNGVFKCDIDARSNKVTVQASTKLDPYFLVAKLRKSGKQAELWPEQPPPPQQQQPPAEGQSQGDEPSKPAEKPSHENAEAGAAAEPSNPQPSPEPKQSAAGGEAPKPAEEKTEASNAGDGAPPEARQQQPSEAKGKARQQQPPEDRHPVNARVTVEYDDRGLGGGRYAHRMPLPQEQQPVHVMSYNVARPSASASYYAAAPALEPMPMPMPMARPGSPPSQAGYIDEQYTPSYHHARSTPYEFDPYYYPAQPSPYRYQYQQQPSPAEDHYYYGAPTQRSAFSPPRVGYGEMFNDENANSCSVM